MILKSWNKGSSVLSCSGVCGFADGEFAVREPIYESRLLCPLCPFRPLALKRLENRHQGMFRLFSLPFPEYIGQHEGPHDLGPRRRLRIQVIIAEVTLYAKEERQ